LWAEGPAFPESSRPSKAFAQKFLRSLLPRGGQRVGGIRKNFWRLKGLKFPRAAPAQILGVFAFMIFQNELQISDIGFDGLAV
jgi:hypothetical protein